MNRGIKTLKALYLKAKSAKVGETAFCPSCGKPFEKTNYQQAFCKNNSGTICKDYYWNNVTPNKRNNKTRISPASASFMADRSNALRPMNTLAVGKFQGYTSEGYRVFGGIAFDEFDEEVYHVDRNDDRHPFDLED